MKGHAETWDVDIFAIFPNYVLRALPLGLWSASKLPDLRDRLKLVGPSLCNGGPESVLRFAYACPLLPDSIYPTMGNRQSFLSVFKLQVLTSKRNGFVQAVWANARLHYLNIELELGSCTKATSQRYFRSFAEEETAVHKARRKYCSRRSNFPLQYDVGASESDPPICSKSIVSKGWMHMCRKRP